MDRPCGGDGGDGGDGDVPACMVWGEAVVTACILDLRESGPAKLVGTWCFGTAHLPHVTVLLPRAMVYR